MECLDARGQAWAVRQREGHLWLTVLWGEPGVEDIAAVLSAWERAVELGAPYRSLVDVREVRRVDPRAFAALADHLLRRRADFTRLLEKQAIVRPDGLVGAVSAGMLTLVEWTARASVFGGWADAVAWLAPDDAALADDYARWRGELIATTPLIARLREVVAADLAGMDIERAARRLGTSSRSLQRHLRASDTSFAAVLDDVRLERAKELLGSSDAKIAVVARDVGYKSEQRFRERFTSVIGATPAEWRARRR